MKTYKIVGYAYDAAFHCIDCTEKRFPNPEKATDSNGNELHPVFAGDEPGESGDFCDDCSEPLENMPEEIGESELHEMYDDMLDDVYPDLTIAGMNYTTSDALKNLDPTAYRCGFNDWLDSEVSSGSIKEMGGRYYRS